MDVLFCSWDIFAFRESKRCVCFVHDIYLASLRAGDLSKVVHHHYLASRLQYLTFEFQVLEFRHVYWESLIYVELIQLSLV